MVVKGVHELMGLVPKDGKKKGVAELSCYEFKNSNDPLHNIRAMFNTGGMTSMIDGIYVRLRVEGKLVMSDTRMEKNSNYEFLINANGRVFIAGLGLGMIIHNLRDKVKDGVITEIVIMEIEKDVIDLVSPFYKDLPITYIIDNILTYKPTKEDVFDTIYFDIWADICTDNLSEIKMLHNRWKFKKNIENPKCWMNSWMKEFLQQEHRKSSYY